MEEIFFEISKPGKRVIQFGFRSGFTFGLGHIQADQFRFGSGSTRMKFGSC